VKTCNCCRKRKSEDEFYLSRGKPRAVCKKCWAKKRRDLYLRKREDRISYSAIWKKENPGLVRSYGGRSGRRLKTQVLEAYGGPEPKCACCGESDKCFLVIDHIHGGGNKHRRSITGSSVGGAGYSFYRWLRIQKYPAGFQVLCQNCNFAKTAYGACPHKVKGLFEKALLEPIILELTP
jgi:hypothetical protein